MYVEPEHNYYTPESKLVFLKRGHSKTCFALFDCRLGDDPRAFNTAKREKRPWTVMKQSNQTTKQIATSLRLDVESESGVLD
jgi:hypothetical protein